MWPGAPAVNNYRGPTVAPHNAYRTQGGGYNDWCVIACFSDQEWQRLVQLMGNPTWATDSELGTLPGRIERQEEMDQGIEKWTLTLEKYELTQKCQEAGVRAIAVQSSQDRVEHDPQLKERGMYSELEHPMLGTWKFQNAPFKLSKSPAEVYRPPPMIGQHNKVIMEDLLGISHQELQEGYEDGTLWPPEMPQFPYIEQARR